MGYGTLTAAVVAATSAAAGAGEQLGAGDGVAGDGRVVDVDGDARVGALFGITLVVEARRSCQGSSKCGRLSL